MTLLSALALLLPAQLRAATGPEVEVIDGSTGTSLVSGESAVSFGTMAVGGLKTVNFTLKNTGDEPLIGLWGLVEGADSTAFAWTPPGLDQLAPGGSTTFGVTFVPGREGEHSARVRVLSSDADENNFLINLTAAGAPRELPVKVEEIGVGEVYNNGPPLDFGSAEVGKSVSRRFKLTNLGTTGLRQVYAVTDDPGYLLGGGARSGFLANFGTEEILPGQSMEFTVRWTPQAVGVKNASVTIIAANLLNAPFRLKIQGTGTSHNFMQPKISGLHFRMGETTGYAAGNVIRSALQDRYPRSDIEMLMRWRYTPPPEPISSAGVENGIFPLFSAQVTSASSILFPSLMVTEDSFEPGFPTFPVSRVVGVSGTGSARETLSSRVAVRFEEGSYLKNFTRKLAASDNVGMELWVRPESTTGRQCITQIGDDEAAGGFGLFLLDGVLRGRVGLQEFAATVPLTLEAWQHIALVLDRGTARLFVNGAAAGVMEEASLPELVKGLGVGATMTGAEPFTGAVDEMRMFETAGDGFVAARDLLLTAKPHAVVDATTLNFDNTIMGAPTSQVVNLTNAGPGWLNVLNAEFLGEDAADFEFWGVNELELAALYQLVSANAQLNTPRGLRPQFQLNFRVKYNPKSSGPSTATLRLTTNDPENPVYDIALNGTAEEARPEIEVTPALMNWETVTAKTVTDFAITVRNKGSLPLTGVSITVAGPHAEDVVLESEPIFPSEIEPGTSRAQRIFIRPAHPGARVATLLIHSNDADENPAVIQLIGRAAPRVPEISVRATPVGSLSSEEVENGAIRNFGTVMQGKSGVSTVSVVNLGWARLEAGLSIEGTNASDFSLSEWRPMEPQMTGYTGTPPYTVVTAIVSFRPKGNGVRTAVLRINNNDADEGSFEIHLTGMGTPAAPVMQVEDRGIAMKPNQGFVRCGTGIIGGAAATAILKVRNAGEEPLSQFQTVFNGAQAGAFSATVSPAEIAPGAVGELAVSFTPTQIGPHAAVLSLASNDAAHPFEVEVGGTGAYGAQANLNPALPEGWVGTAMVQLPNGNVLLAGHVKIDNFNRAKLREIRPDGEETGRFDRYDFWGAIRAVAVDGAGRVLTTGDFSAMTFSDPPRGTLNGGRVFRFNADGSFDRDFQFPIYDGGTFTGHALVTLSDGKVLVGGEGTLGGRANLIRLNQDGSLDTSFALPAPNGAVNALAVQEDGKVLVGGNFTNHGQEEYEEPSADLTLSNFDKPLGGLFRLTTNGEADATFGNPGFQRVTALAVRGDRIAVGGMRRLWHTAEISAPETVPTPSLEEWNTALLSDLTGRTVAVAARLGGPPSAVALQPGDRMIVAPGNDSGRPLEFRPAVALLQPEDQARQMYGQRAAIPSNSPPLVAGQHAFMEIRHQSFGGSVNAVLAQADGKVLVAGGLTKALVIAQGAMDYLDPVSKLSWGGRPMDEAPLPPETVLRGFAQLDVDGFFQPAPVASGSDALTRFEFTTASPGRAVDVPNGNVTATIDGPHAADFTATLTLGTLHGDEPARSPFYDIQFHPTAPGMRYAVLHLSHPDFANTFDIALEGDAASDLPEGMQVFSGDDVKQVFLGDMVSFGAVKVGQSKPQDLFLGNNGRAAVSGSFDLTLVGDHAADFEWVKLAGDSELEPGEGIHYKLTFKPQASGTRTAVLRISPPGGLPFEARLEGVGIGLPAVPSVSGGGRIVGIGDAVSLQASVASGQGITCQWFHNSKPITGATGALLHLNSVGLANAGSYSIQQKNSVGTVMSTPVKLVVINRSVGQVSFGRGGSFSLAAEAAGAGAGELLTYRWLKNGQPLPTEKRITGASSKKFTLKQATAADAGTYTCLISLGTLSLASGDIEVRYLPLPTLAAMGPLSWMVGMEVTDRLPAMGESTLWSITGLPPGVKLDPQTGQLSGNPTRSGVFTLRATLSNPSGKVTTAIPVQVRPLSPSLTGGFLALLDRTPGLFEGCGGLLSLNVTSQGSFTGSLSINNTSTERMTYACRGVLNATGNDSATGIATFNRGPILGQLRLVLDLAGSDLRVIVDAPGTAFHDQTIGSGGQKVRTSASTRNLAFLPPAPVQYVQPGGFARVVAAGSGAVTVTGKLATLWGPVSITLSTHAVRTSEAAETVPLYASILPGESASGWMRKDTANSAMNQGTLYWNPPTNANRDLALVVHGGVWTAPRAGESLLGTDGRPNQLVFKFDTGLAQDVWLTRANRIQPASNSGTWPFPQQDGLLKSLVADPAKGSFSGSTWGMSAGTRGLHWKGALLPFCKVEGLFIPGLDFAVGVCSNLEAPTVDHTFMAQPVTIEVKQ